MHLFYSTQVSEGKIILDHDESKHLVKVLRLSNGMQVSVIDGKGKLYHCTIELAHQKSTVLSIESVIERNEEYGIEVGIAPTKNLNRWEWFLEKVTEIGIDAIHPILSYHSERKILKRDRQERILIAAMKQSYKSTKPQLSDLINFKSFVAQEFKGQKLIAHCNSDGNKQSLKSIYKKGEKALLLIGPEGDFSQQEIDMAKAHGFKSVSLGQNRLRTETAGIIGCHTIHLLNE